MKIFIRLLKYIPDAIKESGLSFATFFKVMTLIKFEPNLEGVSKKSSTNFVYAMY